LLLPLAHGLIWHWTQVFLFLDLKGADADEYRTAYSDLAKASQPKGIKFLIVDAAENENALKASQT
jgi:hypothetical protein